jgi:hypothetical protein
MVPTTEMTIEPMHPSPFEKKTNIRPRYPPAPDALTGIWRPATTGQPRRFTARATMTPVVMSAARP